jgi:mRNA interferase MazF
MAKFIKGDVLVVPFPFSDLTQAKRRPALVITALDGDDLILCQVTSHSIKDSYAVPIDEQDFTNGTLKQPSNARPNRLFTADNHIVLYKVGSLKPDKLRRIIDRVIEIIRK